MLKVHHGALSIPHDQDKRERKANLHLLILSFAYIIAVGTTETADRREVPSPCVV